MEGRQGEAGRGGAKRRRGDKGRRWKLGKITDKPIRFRRWEEDKKGRRRGRRSKEGKKEEGKIKWRQGKKHT